MCLYPTLGKNPKYTKTKKNGGIIPPISDPRTAYVPWGCQKCIECRKQKANNWRVRLLEDIKTNTNGKFITLTFSNESIKQIINLPKAKGIPNSEGLKGFELDNAIATIGVHYFRERWRKHYEKSIRHFLVTELGHQGTENIHMHGILWTDHKYETIEQIWNYGYIWPRPDGKIKTYVNAQTVNYNIKYIHKVDEVYTNYQSKVLASPGIGAAYLENRNSEKNAFKGKNTDESYKTSTGHKTSLPAYYRNKLYTDVEKERLWIHKLDKNERWICGERIDISKNEKDYYQTLEWHRERNMLLGYGTNETWKKKEYEEQRRTMMQNKRILAAQDK